MRSNCVCLSQHRAEGNSLLKLLYTLCILLGSRLAVNAFTIKLLVVMTMIDFNMQYVIKTV